MVAAIGTECKSSIEFLKLDEVAASPSLRLQWDVLSRASVNLYAFYQSPAWWEYSTHAVLEDFILHIHNDTAPLFAKITDDTGMLSGIVGVVESSYSMVFGLKTGILSRFRIPVVRLLGGEPLVTRNDEPDLEFIRSVFMKYPDCIAIHIPWVPTDSACWRAIHESKQLQKEVAVYIPCETYEKHFSVILGDTFSDYLMKFKKNARYHLRRCVEQFNDYAGGELQMLRIEHADDVRTFLDGAVSVSANSWQHELGLQMDNSPAEISRYEQLAEQGVLRCYLLKCGETPCAFIRGFQYGEVFYYSRTGFHEKYTSFSPGKVIFYLMLDDLHSYHPPVRLNFQEGDYEYKRRFANDSFEKTDVLLVRGDLGLHWRIFFFMHFRFIQGKLLAKRMLHAVAALAGQCFSFISSLSGHRC